MLRKLQIKMHRNFVRPPPIAQSATESLGKVELIDNRGMKNSSLFSVSIAPHSHMPSANVP
jgi:hypothetical protein